jgi:hypothetical protein
VLSPTFIPALQSFPHVRLLISLLDRFPQDARWALTCGSALALHGLKYVPSDLDFFAPIEDLHRITNGLCDLQVVFPMKWRTSKRFHSYWGRFLVEGTEVDLVGDFSARHEGVSIAWNAAHPCWRRLCLARLGDSTVRMFSLEDLFMLYLALRNEDAKLRLIASALRNRGCDGEYLESCGNRWPMFRKRLQTLM